MLAEREAVEEAVNEEMHWSLQLVSLQTELKILLMEHQIDIKVSSESYKTWNRDLQEVQQEYNNLVDPFDEAKGFVLHNKGQYTKLITIYNEKCKNIDGYRDELNRKGK